MSFPLPKKNSLWINKNRGFTVKICCATKKSDKYGWGYNDYIICYNVIEDEQVYSSYHRECPSYKFYDLYKPCPVTTSKLWKIVNEKHNRKDI